MKASKLFKSICVLGLASAVVFALSACTTPQEETEDTQIEGLTGGVAATVNGVEIEEDTVTTYIQNWRATQDLLDQDVWGQYLVDNDLTPEKVREDILDSFIKQELIKQAAAENNIEIKSSEIDEYVNKMRDYYDSDKEWEQALEAAGTTEEKYRESIELALIDQAIKSDVIKAEEPTEEEMLEYAQMYASGFDGAKKSSQIQFDLTNAETAQEVLDKIKAGNLDFAEAAKEYSTDTTTASDGGNVGWDALTTLSDEYKEALTGLEVDQISDLVTSDYGLHIIKVTEVFTAPEEVTSTDQLPEEFISAIKESLESTKQSEAYDTWYEEYKESADVKVEDMPESAPYNVDLSKYTKKEDETATDEGTGTDDTATDGTDGTDGTEGTDGAATDGTEGAEGDAAAGETPTDDATATDGAEGEDAAAGEGESGNDQPAEAA